MKIRRDRLLFWTGLLSYATSFFLPVTAGPGTYTRKLPSVAEWALDSLLFPFIYVHWHDWASFWSDSPLAHLSVLITGFINPLFIAFIILLSLNKIKNGLAIWQCLLALMVPFTWIVFHRQHVYPREGYIFWLAGVLLVLLSSRFRRQLTPPLTR
jgi:hypothetical protein